jgi:hypothetical protein
MSNARVVAFASLLLVAFAAPASAQAPADSAAADSLKPKKSGRFGGMLSKAKKVAENKRVQGAVKGAATNVACNAVPGVAVATAAGGGGPCQNTLMGGLVSKGMKGTAAMVAGGAASTAAANVTGKLGSTTTAAAAGALGAGTGKSALSQAAAATAAGMMPKGLGGMIPKGGKGASDASVIAAQAAAMKMMQGGGGASGAKMPSGADMAAAVAAMNAMNTAATGGKKIETIDFRELKAMLPASLSGLKRTDATGEKSGAMGMQISSAEGTYSADDGKQINVKITDIGALAGLGAMSSYAWAQTDIDRESDNAYEKSTTFKGYKAFEKYDKRNHSGDFSVLVGGRFVVEAEGSNVDMKAIKSALDGVDLRKLDGMKGKGVH